MTTNFITRSTIRGVKKCPKCKIYNGYRSTICKNKECGEILKLFPKGKETQYPMVISSKLNTDSDSSIYSVRIRNTGPDYRGFVELKDVENYWIMPDSVQSNSSSGLCYIKSCNQFYNANDDSNDKSNEFIINCQHIQESVNTSHIAESLPIKHSMLETLKINNSMKEDIWKQSIKINSPLVQRISQQVMVIKTKKSKSHPLGYLHMLFVPSKKRYYCNCDLFTSKSVRRKETINHKRYESSINSNSKAYNGKCVHFYSCMCAFASNKDLSSEFDYFIKLAMPSSPLYEIIKEDSKGKSKNDFIISIPDTENSIVHISDNSHMHIDNDPSSPYATQTIELQDGNTLMMEFHTDQDWKSQEESSQVELNDFVKSNIIFVKSNKDNEIDSMCDVFLENDSVIPINSVKNEPLDIEIMLADHTDDKLNTKKSDDKPLDIQIMLTDNSDVLKLPNFMVQEVPIENSKNKISIMKSINNNEDRSDKIFLNDDMTQINNDELAILTDDYNSLEIMSLEQYNYLINKQENFSECFPNNKNKKSSNPIKKSILMDDCDDELLFLGINDECDNEKMELDVANKSNVSDKINFILDDSKVNKNIMSLDISKNNLQQILDVQNQNDLCNVFMINENVVSNIVNVSTASSNADSNKNDYPDILEHLKKNEQKPKKAKRVQNVSLPMENISFMFTHWLSSVTERINHTMHFQFNGKPDPLLYQIPQAFFDCLRDRISKDTTKKRLPNSVSIVTRSDTPSQKFTKYTWNIVNIHQVKQIFHTPNVQLEVVQYFSQKMDSTYMKIEKPDPVRPKVTPSLIAKNITKTKQPVKILPGSLVTYLKVGKTTLQQSVPTPFCIEWTADILPKSKVGELALKYEFGHKNKYTA